MKKYLSIASFIIFFITLAGVITFYSDSGSVKRESAIFFIWILPTIGLILGIFGKKGFFKIGGLIGHILILTFTAVIPFVVTTFFWNTP
ncbi:hypothetical protein [Niallia sp. FSL R7-0271]|uniref:hypothetical protein n=1 Tax=Niallia sp. FSL R7-0271 TaxID=2921678 RepID=UPI0030F9FB48